MALPPDDGRSWRLDLADSEIASLETWADGWALHLAVACLRPLRPRLGAGDETLWWTGVRLEARGGTTRHDAGMGGRVVAADLQGPGVIGRSSLCWQDGPLGPCRGTVRAVQGELRWDAHDLIVTVPDGASGQPSLAC